MKIKMRQAGYFLQEELWQKRDALKNALNMRTLKVLGNLKFYNEVGTRLRSFYRRKGL